MTINIIIIWQYCHAHLINQDWHENKQERNISTLKVYMDRNTYKFGKKLNGNNQPTLQSPGTTKTFRNYTTEFGTLIIILLEGQIDVKNRTFVVSWDELQLSPMTERNDFFAKVRRRWKFYLAREWHWLLTEILWFNFPSRCSSSCCQPAERLGTMARSL